MILKDCMHAKYLCELSFDDLALLQHLQQVTQSAVILNKKYVGI